MTVEMFPVTVGALGDESDRNTGRGVQYQRAWAHVSADGWYRWHLGRIWDPKKPSMHFVMLNPSTADGEKDDPTIRKCVGFAQRAGCGVLHVTNLFSYRATDPADLLAVIRDSGDGVAIGHETNSYITDIARTADITVFAWGANARHSLVVSRAAFVAGMVCGTAGARPVAYKTTADNIPCHPLMLPYSLKFKVWEPRFER